MFASIKPILLLLAAFCSGMVLFLAGVFLYLNPQIPPVSDYREVRLQTPLRIYDDNGKFLAEFGERRRIPIEFEEIPEIFVDAVLSIEDKRFYEHSGVDVLALARALMNAILSGKTESGASTITMQLARNVSLTRRKTFIRKFKEMLLALKIEGELGKDEILELYLNLIPYGKRAYGAQAAAYTYYGKPLDELTLAQYAMLAGIPQAPSAANPVNNPQRALQRRNQVLLLMFQRGVINGEQYEQARAAPVTARLNIRENSSGFAHFTEMIRQQMVARYGLAVYEDGYEVRTTLDSELQTAAAGSVRRGILDYSRRHGFRGREAFIDIASHPSEETLLEALAEYRQLSELDIAVVIKVASRSAQVLTLDKGTMTIPWAGLSWARRYIDANRMGRNPKTATEILSVGDVVWIQKIGKQWHLAQVPHVQGALVAMDPDDGAVLAMMGGYDFRHSQFNHATQGSRQPGSSFKPFVYAAALHNGITLAHVYNDAPLVFEDEGLETLYRPRNSGGEFRGLTLVRTGFYKSVNLVSMRMVIDVGVEKVIDYLQDIGFATENYPRNLQLAIGGGTISLTPLQMTAAYALFANGGYRVEPYLIRSISRQGEGVVHRERRPVAGARQDTTAQDIDSVAPAAMQVMDPRVNFQINSMMQDVINRGTGVKAKQLKHPGLSGKTGTTDSADTWFSGFNSDIVTVVWVGFSDNSPLGDNEFGATTALPIWIEFMREALKQRPGIRKQPPEGLIQVKINPETGKPAKSLEKNAIFEWFLEESVPKIADSSPEETAQEVEIF